MSVINNGINLGKTGTDLVPTRSQMKGSTKGDHIRGSSDQQKYADNWEKIFGKKNKEEDE